MTFLAAGSSVSTDVILSVTIIAIASLCAPLLSYITNKRIPGVVFMLILGVLIGPQVLGWAHTNNSVALLRELGLGMLFLLAGWEINPDTLKGRQTRWGILSWSMSMIIGFVGAIILFRVEPLTAVVLAIAVSSTALGTLLPIAKTAGLLESPIGKGVMVHGAIGELAPIFAMALLLSTRATWITLIILLLFFAFALLIAFVPRTIKFIAPWIARAVKDGASHTSQTIMRAVFVLLTVLMLLASVFQLDVVLGAFAAGIILRALVPARARRAVEARLDVMGYGLFIPIFFITSGMSISISAVSEKPLALIAGVIGIAIARGLPIFLAERTGKTDSGVHGVRDQLQLSLYSATGLPIIVAVTEIAVQRELIDDSSAALLVSCGACTVLLFPLISSWVARVGIAHIDKSQPTEEIAQEAQEYREAMAHSPQEKTKKPQSSTVNDDEITI